MSVLIRGLKYVIPCQSRFDRKPVNETTAEQYQRISATGKSCLEDNRVPITTDRTKEAFSALQCLINELQARHVPNKLKKRSQREFQIVRSIQRLMLKTNAYEQVSSDRCPLADNSSAVQTLLNTLFMKHALTKKQLKWLSPKTNKLELGHYHGLSKPHKPGTPLRPIVACMHAPVSMVSKFLNDLLAPIYLTVARESTFINDIDVIRKLEKYAANAHLKPTTKLITTDVENLYTMIPRQGALEALARFCVKNSQQGKIGTFSTDHIMKMARLILDTTYFAYNDKYYKQIRGGAIGSAFTQVLANIYMLEWEQELIQYQTTHHEIYGRYIDDIFMTTNRLDEEITAELEKAKVKEVNIRIESTMATSVHFLDITITNENGLLRTSVYHKPTAELYILPYTSNHPHNIRRNIPYAALMRAARICSHVQDFNAECVRLDMSLLLNCYPPNFISKQFTRFFRLNDAMPVRNELDEEAYCCLHQKLLHQPTRRQKQLQRMMQDPVKTPAVLQPKIWNRQLMFPHHLYDSGLTISLPQEFYRCWKTYYAFSGSPIEHVKVRLVTDTNRTLESFIIHKKPPR